MASVPYPGFSWSISQHIGPVTQQGVLYELLQAAYIFSGDVDYSNSITNYLVDQELLTPNVRQDAGRPQAWRDYQQVLAELGLIVSTRFTDNVIVTPIALMWLDGLIGYSELITTQCLRYQYPNGHKQDISPSLRTELYTNNIAFPQTRTELDTLFGVQVKPAVLLLRILLELKKLPNQTVSLTPQECLAALVPIKTNRDWPLALNTLLSLREKGFPNSDTRRLRHVQEWFRLLVLSDIFVAISRSAIGLRELGLVNENLLVELCEYHEDPVNYWMPSTTSSEEMAFSWFQYYGNPPLMSQWIIPELKDTEYLEANYPAGAEVDEVLDDLADLRERNYNIVLKPLDPFFTDTSKTYSPSILGQDDIDRVIQGQIRRQRSTYLHQKIVEILAHRLQQFDFSVMEDPQSVDLLASKDKLETIIEVKTVNRRNLYRHMRLGVGQLSEYRFRRQFQTGSRPKAILVLSSSTNFPSWLLEYFETDIHLGLVSMSTSEKFLAYTSGDVEKFLSD